MHEGFSIRAVIQYGYKRNNDDAMSPLSVLTMAPQKMLPMYNQPHRRPFREKFKFLAALAFAALCLSIQYYSQLRVHRLAVSEDIVARCKALNVTPAPPPQFFTRTESDRYEPGTPPILIRNATIWTGDNGGNDVFNGDILLDKGLIKQIATSIDVSGSITVVDVEVCSLFSAEIH